jgi:low temperature requirement protein LtrA
MDPNEAIENYKKALSMKESLWKDIERIRKKSSFDYFHKIALPIVIASITIAATAVYHFTRQIELVILAILTSLVISIGLFSFIKGKLGRESFALIACLLVIIWLGANILGIEIDAVASATSAGTIASLLSTILAFLTSLRTKKKLNQD